MPGTTIEVQALSVRVAVPAGAPALLLVHEGQLIVDLPDGQFRVLEAGDSLMLPVGVPVTLQPVAGQAILSWHDPR